MSPDDSSSALGKFRDHLAHQDGYGWWLAVFFLLPLPLAEALTAFGLAPFFEGVKPYLGLARFLEAGVHAPQVWVYATLVIAATPCAFVGLGKATNMQAISRGTAWGLLIGCTICAGLFLAMLVFGFPPEVAVNPTRAMRRILVVRQFLLPGYGFYLCVLFSIVFFAFVALTLARGFILEFLDR